MQMVLLFTRFNIIYSLFRTENLENAEEMFIVFQEKVPLYIKISKEVHNLNTSYFHIMLF